MIGFVKSNFSEELEEDDCATLAFSRCPFAFVICLLINISEIKQMKKVKTTTGFIFFLILFYFNLKKIKKQKKSFLEEKSSISFS